MKYKTFTDAVEILDSFRIPVNKKERADRIAGKSAKELYPYYGATGQAGVIDGYLIDGEYVLLGEDGAPFLDAYATKAYLINGKAWINNHVHILKSKTNNKFLCYYLNYFNYKGYVSGTTRLKLTQADMKRIPIPDFSSEEQERIVEYIEELFSELDAGVKTLKKIKQQLAVYRQAVLSEIFLKEVKRFPYTEYALKDIVEKDDGLRRGPFGGSIKKQCFVPAGYKVYEQGNAINDSVEYGHYFISEEKYQEMKGFQVKPFDLLVSCSGTLGRITELPWNAPKGIINQALLRIRINRDIVESEYFIQYFRAGFFQKKIVEKSQGSAMQNLVSIKEFKEIKLAIPQKKYQKHITELVSEKLSCCDSIEKTVDEALQQSAAMGQSILKQAFEGGL